MSLTIRNTTILVTILFFCAAGAFGDEPAPAALTWPGLAAAKNGDTLSQELNLIYDANVRMSDARMKMTGITVNYDNAKPIPSASVNNELGELTAKMEVARRERNLYMSGLRVLSPAQLEAFQKSIPDMKKTLEEQAQAKFREYDSFVNQVLGEHESTAADRQAILVNGKALKIFDSANQMRNQIETLTALEAQLPTIIEASRAPIKATDDIGQIDGDGNPAKLGRILSVPDPTIHTAKKAPK